MTRIFTEDGAAIPVTVLSVEPNRVTQLKTLETDGYRAGHDRLAPRLARD
jgi:large subunit ribosomal protein L3